jgi:hypothetical protein
VTSPTTAPASMPRATSSPKPARPSSPAEDQP